MSQSPKSIRSGTSGEGASMCMVWAEVGIGNISNWGCPNVPESTMSYMACRRAVQRSVWCPTDWWYIQYKSSRNCEGTRSGSALGARGAKNPMAWNVSKTLLRGVLKSEKCLHHRRRGWSRSWGNVITRGSRSRNGGRGCEAPKVTDADEAKRGNEGIATPGAPLDDDGYSNKISSILSTLRVKSTIIS